MKQTGDLFLVKKINKSIVLDMIRTRSPISRAKVSELTGLNKTTVSSLVNELIDEHLVHEMGPGKSSGGRKPLMLLFNEQAGYAIGVDVRIDSVSAILTDLKGTIKDRSFYLLESNSAEHICSVIVRGVRDLSVRAPETPYGIVGVGVGVPGIVDEHGSVLFAPNLNWSNIPLQQMLTDELQLPVVIDNEANAGAVSEHKFGGAQDTDDLLYVSVSHGIGTGILLGGHLYRGSSGFAGEAGHFSIKLDGEDCSCGNKGCWELYASENALLLEAGKLESVLKNTEGSPPALEDVIELAASGDPDVLEVMQNVGRHLGIGISNLINLFNPQRVIIGNRIALAEPWIAKALYETVKERSLSFHFARVSLEISRLQLDSGVLGAASFAQQAFFAKTQISL
ncbi:ROK family protein [Paenibacillus physcomitrellae]|uniref:Xylose repressor n=1 Tax=Paenibacillus physcomitrellae TaxID=1619311 RepID=A0ABQ1GB47_9BACL|nr:ROK family protein [Paenibacillus physcomitrellae]GGA40311.1 xylose repressor [Paenibacillus physcomitrellae]